MTILQGSVIYLGKVAIAILAIRVADKLYEATSDKAGHEAPPWIRLLMICELLGHPLGWAAVLTALFLIPIIELLKKS